MRTDLTSRLKQLVATHGMNDGMLHPADLAAADPVTRRIVQTIWRTRAQRERPHKLPRATDEEHSGITLPLAEIERDLPAAVGEVLCGKKTLGRELDSLYVGAMGESVSFLAGRYHADVLGGSSTTTQFLVRHGLHSGTWQLLRDRFGALFPSSQGAREKDAAPNSIEELARAWQPVARGELSVYQFLAEQRISTRQMNNLRASRPDLFPTPGIVRNKRGDDDVLTEIVAEKARAMLDRSVLTERGDVIHAFNADKDLVARFGEMTVVRYASLFRSKPRAFPVFRDQKRSFAVLGKEIHALLAKDPDLAAKDIVAAMQERHPRFDQQWLRRVRQKNPDITYRLRRDREPGSEVERQRDARLLADTMAATPGQTISATARALAREHPVFKNPRYSHNLIRDFRDQVFGPATRTREIEPARTSFAMQELFRLASAVAPPGTSEEDLGRVMDELVAERGTTLSGHSYDVYTKYRNMLEAYDRPEDRGARLFHEILGEYADAAAKGTPEAEVVARVMEDYPTLTKWRLGRYRGLWKQAGGDLDLTGRGRQVKNPRYLGGWDPVRALGGAAEPERRLARATQYARIPLHLPLLDAVLGDVTWASKRPLHHHNVLWVSHLLGSSYALSRALVRAGMRKPSAVIVGTPYGTNEAVRATLEGDGFDVRVPALDEKAYRDTVKQALADILAKDGPLVVMDDGGLVAELLHTEPEFRALDKPITIVEQTTAGIRKAEARSLRYPVISVARSKSKQEESKLIGRAVAEKVAQGISRLGRGIEGAEVVVIGGGWVGSATAARLRAQGAHVAVIDSNEDRQREANPGRKRLPPRATLLADADIVIGATGERSLSLDDLRLLKDEAVVLSASSKRVEIDMQGLSAAASSRAAVAMESPNVRLPTARYRLGNKSVVVLGDGWPVNFDGDVEDIAADEIQLTRAAMLVGALQAASTNPGHFKNQRVVPLDPHVDDLLLARYRALRKGRTDGAIGDPDAWRDVVRDLAARFR